MTEPEFLERLAEALGREMEGFSMQSPLQDEPTFDSVAVLSIIILMDEMGKNVQGPAIRQCLTPAELWAL
jgi:hypothetical protein